MPFNETLAGRVRDCLEGETVVEKKMFGGLAFMVRGPDAHNPRCHAAFAHFLELDRILPYSGITTHDTGAVPTRNTLETKLVE